VPLLLNIDEVRVWHSAKTAAEIIAIRDAENQPSEVWHYRHFGSAALDWGADSDNDAINRLGEFAFGGSPKLYDTSPMMCAEYNMTNQNMEFTFNRRIQDSHDLIYTLQASGDLSTWTPLSATQMNTQSVLALGTDYESVTYQLNATVTAATKQFYRVKAELD